MFFDKLFETDGYFKLTPNDLPDGWLNAVDKVNVLFDDMLNHVGGNPKSREDAKKWIDIKRKYQNHKDILALFNKYIINMDLFKEKTLTHVKWSQIAFRFPNERVGEKQEWHIDKGLFEVLVGIYLTNNDVIDCGNLILCEKSHNRYERYKSLMDVNKIQKSNKTFLYRKGITEAEYFERMSNKNNINKDDIQKETKRKQMQMKKGDVIFVDARMCHDIAPNRSNQTRRVIYFRTCFK